MKNILKILSLILFILLLIAIVAGNVYLGQYLKINLLNTMNTEKDIKFSYDSFDVNPLMREIRLRNLYFFKENSMRLKSTSLRINTSYREMWELFRKDSSRDVLNNIIINAEGLSYSNYRTYTDISAAKIILHFTGRLDVEKTTYVNGQDVQTGDRTMDSENRVDNKENERSIFDNGQKLSIEAAGFNIETPLGLNFLRNDKNWRDLLFIDDIEIEAEYNPVTMFLDSNLTVNDSNIDLNANLSVEIMTDKNGAYYQGNTVLNANGNINGSNLVVGREASLVYADFDNLAINLNYKIDNNLSEYREFIPEGKVELDLTGLDLLPNKMYGNRLLIPIDFNKVNIIYTFDNPLYNINTKIESSVFDGKMNIDLIETARGVFLRDSEITLENMQEEIEEIVNSLEKESDLNISIDDTGNTILYYSGYYSRLEDDGFFKEIVKGIQGLYE